jgi:hypothetical protein
MNPNAAEFVPQVAYEEETEVFDVLDDEDKSGSECEFTHDEMLEYIQFCEEMEDDAQKYYLCASDEYIPPEKAVSAERSGDEKTVSAERSGDEKAVSAERSSKKKAVSAERSSKVCKHGDDCKYRVCHHVHPTQKRDKNGVRICTFFLKGTCTKDDKCDFSHETN